MQDTQADILVVTGPVSPETIESAGQTVREDKSDRRADVDSKQLRMAAFLEQLGCDGLLVLDQANLAWLTSGASSRYMLDPDLLPALYYTATQRWLICCNVESQRMFDEEIGELGFLLKEWPWHLKREQLLGDICQGRTFAADVPYRDARVVGDQFKLMRRSLSPYEQACSRLLGQLLGQALESTCRHAEPGDSERDIAGQLSHRLMRRGAMPVAISVAADGRLKTYRRHGFTSAPVLSSCVVIATAKKYGLYSTASRSFSFGPADETFKKEHLAACRIAATYIANTWPDAVPKEILNAGRRVFLITGYEHEWRLAPQGYITARLPVEVNLDPELTDLLQPGMKVTWSPTVGAAASSDSFLVSDAGPELVTLAGQWPLVSVRVSGNEFFRPHILQR